MRAAGRRGSSIRMRWSASQGSSSNASGTRVVLPEPVAAVNTACPWASAALSLGSTGSIGNLGMATGIGRWPEIALAFAAPGA